jgi:hypothetical protein
VFAQTECYTVQSGQLTTGSGCPKVGDKICKANHDICVQSQQAVIGLCSCSNGFRCGGQTAPPPVLSDCQPESSFSGFSLPQVAGYADRSVGLPAVDCGANGDPCGPSDPSTAWQLQLSEYEQKRGTFFDSSARQPPSGVPVVTTGKPSQDRSLVKATVARAQALDDDAKRYTDTARCTAALAAVDDALDGAQKDADRMKRELATDPIEKQLGKWEDQAKDAAFRTAMDAVPVDDKAWLEGAKMAYDRDQSARSFADATKEFYEATKFVDACAKAGTCTLKDLQRLNAALSSWLKKVAPGKVGAAIDRVTAAQKKLSSFVDDLLARDQQAIGSAVDCLGR